MIEKVKLLKRLNLNADQFHPYKMKRVVCSCIFLLILTHAASGQTGNTMGKVSDARTGKPLEGVRVDFLIDAGASVTNRNGVFSSTGQHSGSQRILITTPGYAPKDTTVLFGSNLSFLEFQLVPNFTEIDDRYDKSLKFKQAQAYARQKHSFGMVHSISSSQMMREGDYTVQTGLRRVSGVQVGRRGELNIRGVGRDMFEVTVDGQRMASSSPDSRFTNPGSISGVLAQDVDIVKVLTPDMDAEGIGGVVRINTWRPIGKREITAQAGGMANPRYSLYSGLGSTMSLSYSERFKNDFAMAATISYQSNVNGYDGLDIDYGAVNFGAGYVDVIERLAPALNYEKNDIIGSKIQFSFQPSKRSSYYMLGLLNVYDNNTSRHRNVSIPGNDWIDQTTTGNAGRIGTYRYDASLIDGNDFNFTLQAGGQHFLDRLKVDYNAGWSHSLAENSHYYFPFISSNLNYKVDMNDRTRPTMEITNVPLMQDGTLDRRLQNFQNLDRIRDEHDENRYSARVNVEVPLGNLRFKFGSSGLWTDKSRGFSDAAISTVRRYDLLRFETVPRGAFNVLNQYTIPWIIYPERVADFVNLNKPDLRVNNDITIKNSEIWNNQIFESVYGAYGIIVLNIGNLSISGGLRTEYTYGEYHGSNVVFNRFDTFMSTDDTSSTASYLNLFPNAVVNVSPWSNSNIKVAYSRSIKRQAYSLLAPFELVSAIDTTRFFGNPDLKPVVSDNVDMMFEQYLNGIGQITVGAFYKELSNLAFLQEKLVDVTAFPFHTVPDGQTIETKERTYKNSDKPAKIYGLEVSWQQYLGFVPAAVGDIGVYANYTWTRSTDEGSKQNGDVFAMMHQSPHAVNVALDFYRGRFSGGVAWHWSAVSLYRMGEQEQWAPALNNTEPVYVNLYEDGFTDLSASFGFRFSSNFRFWANAQNLLNNERILYGENRNLYPFSTDLNSGLRVTAGLTFTM